MTIGEALLSANVPRIDAELLLAHVLCKTRTYILAHPEHELLESDRKKFEACIQRRAKEEPVAYIIGEAPFYGRMFSVTHDVLIPRPATEGLIEQVEKYIKHPQDTVATIDSDIVAVSRKLREGTPTTIIDVGTGSGCIAITLALQHPEFSYFATDISPRALRIAQQNAKRYGVENKIQWREMDLFSTEKICHPFLIVSNPPYIPLSIQSSLSPSVIQFEPSTALFAGEHGVDVIKRLVVVAKKNLRCTGIILECRADQVETIDESCSLVE